MDVITLKVGYLKTNCYFLLKNEQCLVVDPGGDTEKLLDVINKYDFKIVGYLVTHMHHDHIGSLEDMLTNCNAPVYSKENLNEGENTISNFNFEVIYTPGHTDDSITFYFKEDNLMLTGDFLFKETIGRYDLETSSFIDMKESLNKIKKYEKNVDICPGHGERTNLKHEKENNLYLMTY